MESEKTHYFFVYLWALNNCVKTLVGTKMNPGLDIPAISVLLVYYCEEKQKNELLKLSALRRYLKNVLRGGVA